MVKSYKLVETNLEYNENHSSCIESMSDKFIKLLQTNKYTHQIDEDEDGYISSYNIIINDITKTKKRGFDCDFKIANNKITLVDPIKISLLYKIDIDCIKCDKSHEYTFTLNDNTITYDIDYCSYYVDAAIKIQRYIKLRQKIPVLWKILEYYTAKKYAPCNILKYINLEN